MSNVHDETMGRERESLQARRSQLIERLRALGVERVEVEYDGSGDSGDVQSVQALKKKGEHDEAVSIKDQSITVERLDSVYDPKDKEWKRVPYQAVIGLEKALGDFATDFLSFLEIDWYNNEGGFGTVVLDVAEGKVRADHYTRYESAEFSGHVL